MKNFIENMISRILFWIFIVKVVAALPAGVYIGKDGSVGASWGGYSASAGLGGLVGGAGPRGGLHAQAGTPDGHFASAGLGGSVSEGAGPQGVLYSSAGHANPVVVETPVVQPVAVAPAPVAPAVTGGASSHASASASASSSANSGSHVQGGVAPVVFTRKPGSFFDDIFNIPISTLTAVNQYLNNRNKGVVHVQRVQPVQGSQSNSFSSSSASSSSSSSSSSASSNSAASSNGVDNNIYHSYQKSPNYNDIFNIPISVLGAVNRFLNG